KQHQRGAEAGDRREDQHERKPADPWQHRRSGPFDRRPRHQIRIERQPVSQLLDGDVAGKGRQLDIGPADPRRHRRRIRDVRWWWWKRLRQSPPRPLRKSPEMALWAAADFPTYSPPFAAGLTLRHTHSLSRSRPDEVADAFGSAFLRKG